MMSNGHVRKNYLKIYHKETKEEKQKRTQETNEMLKAHAANFKPTRPSKANLAPSD